MSAYENGNERRRCARLRIQIPLFIRGANRQGTEFVELAKTLDISGVGARLVMPCRLSSNEVVQLTIPAPLPRSAELDDCGTPPIAARVRRVESSGELEMAAVEFLKPLV